MLLTILIPTRNRRRRVKPLVAGLIANLPAASRGQVEIVVLDNASTDGTSDSLQPLLSETVRLVTRPELLPTSEQNVFDGLQHARGEFVWFHGDDDLPRFNSVARLLDLLRDDPADLFISNFRVMDKEGKLASVAQIRGAPHDVEMDLVGIIKRVGMINTLSGWSIIVARRSMLDVQVAERIMQTSIIYAHCFWFLECFADARVRFLSEPLVDYRVFHHKKGWQDYTAERDVGYLFYWHLALLRLYKQAIDRGVITPADISQTYEYRHNGTRYRAIDEIVFKLIEQADVYVKTGLPRELLTPEQLSEATEVLLQIDLSLQDLLMAVEDVYRTLWREEGGAEGLRDFGARRARAMQILIGRQGDLFAPLQRGLVYGYVLYAFGHRWIGIRHDALAFEDAVFSQLLPRSMFPGVIVKDTREALLEAIKWAPAMSEPIGGRPPYVSLAGDAAPIQTSLPEDDEDPATLVEARRLRRLAGEEQLAEEAYLERMSRPPAPRGTPITPEPLSQPLWMPNAAASGAEMPVILILGWSLPEQGGVWSTGDESVFIVEPPEGVTRIGVAIVAFAAPGASRGYSLRVDGEEIDAVELPQGGYAELFLPAPADGRAVHVSLRCTPSETPAEILGTADTRPLGAFLRRVWAELG